MQYPYIATIQHPTIFTKAFSANISQPYQQDVSVRSNLVLQYQNELHIYEINHDQGELQEKQGAFQGNQSQRLANPEFDQNQAQSKIQEFSKQNKDDQVYKLICKQPIYLKIITVKRLKPTLQNLTENMIVDEQYRMENGQNHSLESQFDSLFVMTSDLKMHIMRYSQSQKELEIVSSFQLDMGKGGKKFEEVSYITYDEINMNVIVIFQSNYAMIVDLELNQDNILEISNYTVTELSIYNYVKIKKLRIQQDQKNVERSTNRLFIAILYDGIQTENQDQSEESKNTRNFNNTQRDEFQPRLCLYSINSSEEQEGLSQQTKSIDLTYTIPLTRKGSVDMINDIVFTNFAFSQEFQQFMFFGQTGLWVYDLNFEKIFNSNDDNFTKFVPLVDQVSELIWLNKNKLVLYSQENSGLKVIKMHGKSQIGIEYPSFQEEYENSSFNNYDKLIKLGKGLLFLPSTDFNHVFVSLKSNKMTLKDEILNYGSITETKTFSVGSKFVLQKGSQGGCRIYQFQNKLQITPKRLFELPDDLEIVKIQQNENQILEITLNDGQSNHIVQIDENGHFNLKESNNVNVINSRIIEDNVEIKVYESKITRACPANHFKELFFNNAEIITSAISQIYTVLTTKDKYLQLIRNSNLEVVQRVKLEKDLEIHQLVIQDIDIDLSICAIQYWNESKIELFKLPNLIQPLHTFDLQDISTFQSIQIDRLDLLTLQKQNYMFVSLSNGYMFIFNLYPQIIKNLLTFNLDPKLMLRLNRIFKVGSYIYEISKLSEDSLMVCSDISILLSVDQNSRSKSFVKQNLQVIFDDGLVSQTTSSFELCQVINQSEVALKVGSNVMICSFQDLCASGRSLLNEKYFTTSMIQKFDYVPQLGLLLTNEFDSFDLDNYEPETKLIKLEQNNKFTTLDSISFEKHEYPSSILIHEFNNKDQIIYIGTTIDEANDNYEFAPSGGNLYIYQIHKQDNDISAEKLHKMSVNGAILDLELMQLEDRRKYLILAVNSNFVIFNLQNSEERQSYDLSEEQVESVNKQTYIYKIKTQGNLIMVADIMKSLTLYKFSHTYQKTECVMTCRDPLRQWCMDMLQIDEDNYLMSDFHCNISILSKEGTAESKNEKIFQLFGGQFVGQQVNTMNESFFDLQAQTQIQRRPEDAFLSHRYLQSQALPKNQSFFDQSSKLDFSTFCIQKQILLGTSDGGISTALLLDSNTYNILRVLQEILEEQVQTLGGYLLKNFRKTDNQVQLEAYETDHKFIEFIDGDFLNKFLEMQDEDQYGIADLVSSRLRGSLDQFSSKNLTSPLSIDKNLSSKNLVDQTDVSLKDIRMLLEMLRNQF
eukprot:403350591